MSIEKPFRICNDLKYSPLSVIQQQIIAPQSTMKDSRDMYELRIYVPYAKTYSFSVFIEDHVLNVNMSRVTTYEHEESANCVRIFLPLDVNEAMVNARVRPYGIKVVMPKKSIKRRGIKIEVPVFTGP